MASKRNPEDYGVVIGARIKRLRESKGYAARKVGAAIGDEGVDASQVYRWESGLNMPTLYNLAEIADVLGCSLDYLGSKDRRPDLRAGPRYREPPASSRSRGRVCAGTRSEAS